MDTGKCLKLSSLLCLICFCSIFCEELSTRTKPTKISISSLVSSKSAALLVASTALTLAGCYLMAKNSSGIVNKMGCSLGGTVLFVLGLTGVIFHEQFDELCQQIGERFAQHFLKHSTDAQQEVTSNK